MKTNTFTKTNFFKMTSCIKLFLWCAIPLLEVCNCFGVPYSEYILNVYNEKKEIVLTCVFFCKDANNDGIIEASELNAFKEVEDYQYIERPNVGWSAYADIDKMPILIKDIKKFRFNEAEFKKGNFIIEYETETKNHLKFGAHYFWRIMKIKKNNRDITIMHYVGDKKQVLGISMNAAMLDKKYTIKITKQ